MLNPALTQVVCIILQSFISRNLVFCNGRPAEEHFKNPRSSDRLVCLSTTEKTNMVYVSETDGELRDCQLSDLWVMYTSQVDRLIKDMLSLVLWGKETKN